MKKISLFVMIISFYGIDGSAQVTQTISPAVPFLDFEPGTNGSAMGNVGTGSGDDCNVFYNIAKIGLQPEKIGVTVSYLPTLGKAFGDAHFTNMQYHQKVNPGNAFALGLDYNTIGNVFYKDNYGNETVSFKPHDAVFYASYIKYYADDNLADNLISPGSALSITFKFFNSSALKGVGLSTGGVGRSVSGIAGNISYYKQWYIKGNENSLGSWGINLSNLGPKIDYFKNLSGEKNYLPATVRVGFGKTKIMNSNMLTLGLDLKKSLVPTPPIIDTAGNITSGKVYDRPVIGTWLSSFMDAPGGIGEEIKEFQLSLGAEYVYNNKLLIRGGMTTQNKLKGSNSYFSFGGGYRTDYFGNKFDINIGYRTSFNTQVFDTFFINLKYKFLEN